jgi:hypothetical protein
VDYESYILARIADPLTRGAMFDNDCLAGLLAAAFTDEALTFDGPFTAAFDEFYLGVSVPRHAVVEGRWGQVGEARINEGRFSLTAPGMQGSVRVDALWRGSIVARFVSANGRIESVAAKWPDTSGIDANIIAELGSLPVDPALLETKRRTRFLALLRASLSEPDAFTDAALGAWLVGVGATSVSDLMTRLQGQVHAGMVEVKYAPPSTDVPLPRALPISAALLIRDAGFSLPALLADSKLVRDHLQEMGIERPRPEVTSRDPLLVIWMVPETLFDDTDWPGGESATNDTDGRRLRLRTAAAWLARESIAIVTTPKHP